MRTCRIKASGGSIAGIVCSLLLCAVVPLAVAQSAVTVVDNGDPENRVDIAILGDGYTAGEMGKYASDVQQIVNNIFSQQPFAEYQRYFNIHRIDVVSNESGADHPEYSPPVYKDTAFDASYNCSGIARVLCVNDSKVLTAASNALLPAERDILLVIVNDTVYGGIGGAVAVASMNYWAVEIVLHEEGHTLGLLADEYDYSPPACNISYEPTAANVTLQTRRNLIKWGIWIDPSTPIPTLTTLPAVPGLYNGAQYCTSGKYRPTFDSKMRNLDRPFEQINTEQIIKRFYNWVSPLDTSLPSATDITVLRGGTQPFSVTTPLPFTHDLSVSWFVDGQFRSSGLDFTLDSSPLSAGMHTVEVQVEDETPMVRNDPSEVLRDGQVWNVRVTDAASSADIAASAGGAAAVSTAGSNAATHAGYATLTVNSGAAPYATAVFSFKQNGVTVTEAGVPASPPTTLARVFIDWRSSVLAVPGQGNSGTVQINTGIAVVNSGTTTANITYTLRDSAGITLSTGNGTIAAGAHFAKFIDQLTDVAPGFSLPLNFQTAIQFASLEVASNQPLSVLALRGTNNQRNDFLITTIPVADLTGPFGTSPIYFPQFVDGGGYTTSLILLNASDVVESGILQILDDNGAPLAVQPVGGAANSSFRYSIQPNGVFRLQTDGSPVVFRKGWVSLIPDPGTSTPIGSGIFAYNPTNTLLSESGIPAAVPTTHARIYLDLSGSHNTGLAIANVAGADADIAIHAFQMDGATGIGAGQGPLLLPAYGHDAKFADQLIAGLPAGFTGVLDISSITPFAALTIRSLLNERHDFLMTTFPIADANQPAPSPIVFPQVADGGSYVTQFIFISPSGASIGTLSFWDETGGSLAVGN